MSERIAPMADHGSSYGGFAVELAACLLSVEGDEPVVLVDEGSTNEARFPSVNFDPGAHESLDHAVRDWLHDNTGIELGRLEQVHTARRSSGSVNGDGEHCSALSIGFLGLVPPQYRAAITRGTWRPCLDFMPWEDRRRRGGLTGYERVGHFLLNRLQAATLVGEQSLERQSRRIRSAFGLDTAPWEETGTLERCTLVQNLVPQPDEADAMAYGDGIALDAQQQRLIPDHLQILAAAIGRLRARLRVRPIAMELVPPVFTLLDLQRSAEAILGPSLHKQNFRRYVEGAGVIEATGTMRQQTGGRPAQLFRFRREGVNERRLASRRLAATGTLQRA